MHSLVFPVSFKHVFILKCKSVRAAMSASWREQSIDIKFASRRNCSDVVVIFIGGVLHMCV